MNVKESENPNEKMRFVLSSFVWYFPFAGGFNMTEREKLYYHYYCSLSWRKLFKWGMEMSESRVVVEPFVDVKDQNLYDGIIVC